jgi:hypothetical protein
MYKIIGRTDRLPVSTKRDVAVAEHCSNVGTPYKIISGDGSVLDINL